MITKETGFVDFLIVGAMKSGTTTLADILSQHPEICISSSKEPHFFSTKPRWREQLEDYRKLFKHKAAKIYGEASTSYTKYPHFNLNIHQDIFEFNPNMKIVYIMRNPLERIISQYMHNKGRGYTSQPFEKAVLTEAPYINVGRYYMQIKPYIDKFGSENVLLLTMEEFLADKKTTLSKIADFLRVDREGFINYENTHTNKSLGEVKANHKAEKLIVSNKALSGIKSFLPKKIKNSLRAILLKFISTKITEKPVYNEDLKKAVLCLLENDIRAIETLMKRELKEWKLD